MSRVTHKLRDQSGASLSAALLLFLICVSLSAVVLTAGTAASGRVSELAVMDQRYYNVTSAARVVKQSFDGETATIKRTRTETAVDGKTVSTEYRSDETFSNASGAVTSAKDPFVVLARNMVYGSNVSNEAELTHSISEDMWSHVIGSDVSVSLPSPLSISVTKESTPVSSLAVIANISHDSTTGNVVFTLENDTGGSSGDIFKFPIGFSATPSETQSSHTDYYYSTTPDSEGNIKTTVTSVTETVKEATISWQVTSFGYKGGEVA